MNEQLEQLQGLEQSLQSLNIQHQHLNSELLETKSALSEISNTTKSYKIIGNIMVEKNHKDIREELEEKQERINLRLESLKKQEASLQENIKNIQEQLMTGEQK